MSPPRRLGFRPLERADFRRLREWLSREHVAAWWGPESGGIAGVGDAAPTLAAVEEHYTARNESGLTLRFVILLDDEPIGLIQTYLLQDHPDYMSYIGVDEGAGVDLLIGEPDRIDKGVGTEVIRAFTHDVVFEVFDVGLCVASPDERNTRSLRAFEKAGYTRGPTVDVPGGTTREVVMTARRSRA